MTFSLFPFGKVRLKIIIRNRRTRKNSFSFRAKKKLFSIFGRNTLLGFLSNWGLSFVEKQPSTRWTAACVNKKLHLLNWGIRNWPWNDCFTSSVVSGIFDEFIAMHISSRGNGNFLQFYQKSIEISKCLLPTHAQGADDRTLYLPSLLSRVEKWIRYIHRERQLRRSL